MAWFSSYFGSNPHAKAPELSQWLVDKDLFTSEILNTLVDQHGFSSPEELCHLSPTQLDDVVQSLNLPIGKQGRFKRGIRELAAQAEMKRFCALGSVLEKDDDLMCGHCEDEINPEASFFCQTCAEKHRETRGKSLFCSRDCVKNKHEVMRSEKHVPKIQSFVGFQTQRSMIPQLDQNQIIENMQDDLKNWRAWTMRYYFSWSAGTVVAGRETLATALTGEALHQAIFERTCSMSFRTLAWTSLPTSLWTNTCVFSCEVIYHTARYFGGYISANMLAGKVLASFTANATLGVFSWIGGVTGAAVGTGLGPLGTTAGSLLGSLAGAFIGGFLGKCTSQKICEWIENMDQRTAIQEALEKFQFGSKERTKILSEGLSLRELRKRYKRLALIHHPDRGGSNEKFLELNLAYGMLLGWLEGKEVQEAESVPKAIQDQETILSAALRVMDFPADVNLSAISDEDVDECFRKIMIEPDQMTKKQKKNVMDAYWTLKNWVESRAPATS